MTSNFSSLRELYWLESKQGKIKRKKEREREIEIETETNECWITHVNFVIRAIFSQRTECENEENRFPVAPLDSLGTLQETGS